jgi:homogentisate 1,2-dioxygenase
MRACLLLLLFPIAIGVHAQRPVMQEKGDDAATERVQVFGTVTDSATGKPVYECMVEHYDLTGKRWSVTTVNADGKYALFIPTGVAFELRVTQENGYLEMSHREKAVPPGTKQLRVDLKLKPM